MPSAVQTGASQIAGARPARKHPRKHMRKHAMLPISRFAHASRAPAYFWCGLRGFAVSMTPRW